MEDWRFLSFLFCWRKDSSIPGILRRYLLRLGVFALLSEIPYDLAFHGTVLEFGHQNVFFTLAASLFVLYGMKKVQEESLKVLILLGGMGICEWFGTDYGFLGVLLPVIYAQFRDCFPAEADLGSILEFFVAAGYPVSWSAGCAADCLI